MECLGAVVGLAVVGGVGFGLIAGLIAFFRGRKVEARLAQVEYDLKELTFRLARLQSAPAAGDAARPTAPVAAEPPAAAPQPQAPAVASPAPAPAWVARPPAAVEPVPASGPPAPSRPPVQAGPAPAPPAPPPARAPQPPAPPAKPAIDWERWLGVRGAAVLGGVVFVLAGLYFLRFSIQQGWITPPLRVAIGTVFGVGAVLAGERLRPRGYRVTADALAGAGIAVLYAAFWAASRLYDAMIPAAAAFGLMALVTVAAGLLAWRHRSQLIAALGLAGGFLTPILLSTGEDRPLSLFGYLLLLDVGLLWLARKRGWPGLAIAGFAATALYQLGWIGWRMDPARVLLGLGILGVFAALFAVAAHRGEGALGRLQQRAAVLVPFAFAVYFAARADLGLHLAPVAALLALLSAAAAFLAWKSGERGLALGAAVADLGVFWVWASRSDLDPALAWEAVAIAAGLAGVFHVVAEIAARRPEQEDPEASAAGLAAAGFLFTLAVLPLAVTDPPLLPWLAGWVALAALLLRQASVFDRAWPRLAAGLGVAVGWAGYFAAHRGDPSAPDPALLLALAAGAGVAFHLAALGRREEPHAEAANRSAVAVPAVALAGLFFAAADPRLSPLLYLGSALALAALAALAATRMGLGKVYLGAVALLAAVHAGWTAVRVPDARTLAPLVPFVPGIRPEGPLADPAALLALGLIALGAVAATLWPFAVAGRFRAGRGAWIAAALAGPLAFPALLALWRHRFGDAAVGLLPLALGALALGAAWKARDLWPAADGRRTSALAWTGAVALGFAAVAIPLQLDRQWITLGWALEGVAVLALWKKLDHPGLKWFGLALLGAVTVRLVANPALLGYHPRGGWPVLNWLLYTYWVPAAALLGAASILRPLEAARARPWEAGFCPKGRATGAAATALAAIAVVFVWINLAVFDAFSTEATLSIPLDRLPGRDLTLSLAWAVYALVLLAVGMARRIAGLRWISLAFLVLTIAKVFLYDLGELEDLYRVASLVGLAVSLILVSLAYQRFVFRRPVGEEKEEGEEG